MPQTLQTRHLLWVLLATLVGLALRFRGLGEWSIWIDEAHTFRDATMPLADFLKTDRTSYPLAFLLLRALIDRGWIGEDPFSLRLPFAIVGVLTIPLVAWFGRRLVGAPAAVVAAWLLAINPWHVFWSQSARGYSFMIFFAVIAVGCAFVHARRRRVRDLVALVLAVAAAGASHPSGALLAPAFGLLYLFRRFAPSDGRGRWWAFAVCLLLVFTLPWLMKFSFPEFFKSKGGVSPVHLLQTTAYFFRPLLLLAAVAGLWLAVENLGRDRALLLGISAVAPFALLLAVSLMVKTTARYAIVTLPVLLWLVGHATVRLTAVPGLGLRSARGMMMALLPLLVASDHVLHLIDYYGAERGQRAPWREATTYLRGVAGQRPLLVWAVTPPTLLYYLQPDHFRHPDVDVPSEHMVWSIEPWMVDEGLDQSGKNKVCEPGVQAHVAMLLQMAQQRGAQLAVAVTRPELEEKDPNGYLRAELRRSFDLVQHYPCWVGPKDDSIYLYLPKEP